MALGTYAAGRKGTDADSDGPAQRRGHRVVRAGGGGMGGYQAILIHPETGMLHGGTDVRKDGQVVGY